jgi:SagB-type dehydrogenase family enzyme
MGKFEDRIGEGRRFVKSNWRALEGVTSDQMRGVPMPPVQQTCASGELIDLVPAAELTVGDRPLIELIRSRKSRRKFTKEALSIEELSFLLFSTQGVRQIQSGRAFRTVPSAGCRHSLETLLYVSRVEGVDEGLYRYIPLHHKLCLVSRNRDLPERLNRALHGQMWNSAAVFFWTAVPYRMEWRYSIVAHKLIVLDVGHVCQNLYLACEAAGCGTCAIGAYDQEWLDEALGLNGQDEFAIYAAPVGKV